MSDDPTMTGSGAGKKGLRGSISRFLNPKKIDKSSRDTSSTSKTSKNAPTSHLLEASKSVGNSKLTPLVIPSSSGQTTTTHVLKRSNSVGNSQLTSGSVNVPSSSEHAANPTQVPTPGVTSTAPKANEQAPDTAVSIDLDSSACVDLVQSDIGQYLDQIFASMNFKSLA